MWKTSVGANINPNNDDDGDWETDPDFINDVTEQEQRWGSKTIEGSGRTVAAIDMHKLREETTRAYELSKQKQKDDGAFGYGGKFGIEKDRMDKCAVGHDYVAKVEKHVSQTDYKGGFGGKFGVQTDRVDKSAVSWDHKENIEKHTSQKDYSQGFGGKYGVEKDRQDKSAVGWDYVEKLQKHDSQNVGKSDNVITEQIQRPSQLKAKFENLAKQNEAKPIEKNKNIPAPKKTSVVNRFTAQNVQEEKIVEKKEEKREIKIQEEKKQEIKQEVKQEIKQEYKQETKQEYKQEIKHEYKQEIKNEYKQEIKKEVKREEIPVAEPTVISQTEVVPNEINANIMISQEDADKLVQELEDESNYTAIALYDYQAAADDEISFDPDEVITNIEMIDEGWWRGTCRGITGLFPANYVQLQDQ